MRKGVSALGESPLPEKTIQTLGKKIGHDPKVALQDSRSSDELQQQVESTQDVLEQDLDSLKARLMPKRLFRVFLVDQIKSHLVTVFFGVTFTLMNPRPIFGALFSLVPARHHDQTLTIMQRIGKVLPGWAGATLLGMLTVGLLVFLLKWPILGFMDALVLGLIAGVLKAVPYLGPLLAAVPALLLAVSKVLAYLTIQALENNVILPIIMARGMKLHPVAVMFSMLLCVAAFGVLGVLVAAPLVAIVDILHDELYRKRFLPGVTDPDLQRLARQALREKVSEDK